MTIATKNGAVVLKNGKTAESCRCCACPAQCTDLLSQIAISISAPESKGLPWTNPNDVLVSGAREAGLMYYPPVYGRKEEITLPAINETIVIPAALLKPDGSLTEWSGPSEGVAVSVWGCVAAVSVTQTSNASLVYADTYYAGDAINPQMVLLGTEGEPVQEYQDRTTETRRVDISFYMVPYREISINQYWDAMDNTIFPYSTARRNYRTWSSAATPGTCADYQSSFALVQSTAGYLSSVQPGGQYDGWGLDAVSHGFATWHPSYGRQIRIAQDFNVAVSIQ